MTDSVRNHTFRLLPGMTGHADHAAGNATSRVLGGAHLGPLSGANCSSSRSLLEDRLELLRAAICDGQGTPEQFEAIANIYDVQALTRGAQMFRNAAASMRSEGKRYGLTYPDNQEHIVLLGALPQTPPQNTNLGDSIRFPGPDLLGAPPQTPPPGVTGTSLARPGRTNLEDSIRTPGPETPPEEG